MAKRDDEGYKAPTSLAELLERAAEIDGGEGVLDHVPAAPTGISSFDLSTGVGGLPLGRVSLFQGEEHSGKTLLLLTSIAQAQRDGHKCAFIDGEHALTPQFARLLGVNWDDLAPFVRRPKTLDAAYELIKEFARSGFFRIVGYDSTTSLTTRAAIDTRAGDTGSRAEIARMHSEELPKLTAIQHPNTAVVLINQMRENPNPPSWHKGGKLLYTPGGKALRHASSLTVYVKLGEVYREGDKRVGQSLKTECIKNKVGTPFIKANFDLMYAQGLDLTSDTIDAAIRMGIIRQSGSWFYLTIVDEEGVELDEKKWAGRKAVEDCLRTDEFIMDFVKTRLAQLDEGDEP
jgi:recombination protein RecA